jgi:pyruvate carboxylase
MAERAPVRIALKDGDKAREATVTRAGDTVTVAYSDGRSFEFAIVSHVGDVLVVTRDGRLLALRGEDIGAHDRQLRVGDRTIAYGVSTPDGQADSQARHLGATIPSMVLEVLVTDGQRVKAGDRIILLESMKMVTPLIAPSDGTVLSVLCAPGEAVLPGVNLIDFDPEDAA